MTDRDMHGTYEQFSRVSDKEIGVLFEKNKLDYLVLSVTGKVRTAYPTQVPMSIEQARAFLKTGDVSLNDPNFAICIYNPKRQFGSTSHLDGITLAAWYDKQEEEDSMLESMMRRISSSTPDEFNDIAPYLLKRQQPCGG